MKNEPKEHSWRLEEMITLLAMLLLWTFYHFAEQFMFSKADSFPIESIGTSGIEVKDNLPKNTQTHILGKKVKTENEQTKKILDTENEVH